MILSPFPYGLNGLNFLSTLPDTRATATGKLLEKGVYGGIILGDCSCTGGAGSVYCPGFTG
jgi:hypothetical protein